MAQAKRKYGSKPGMKTKPATEQDTLKVVNGKTGEVTDTGRRITVIDNTPGSENHTRNQKELEDLTEQVKAGTREIGLRFFEVGQALLQVQDKMLWKYGGHESFSKYLASIKEIRTPQTAYNMMAVARAMDRNMAARFGPSISYVIARASDEDARKELTRMAADGATAAELKQVAKKQRAERGIESRSPGRPKKVERAAQVSGVNGVEKVSKPAKEVKASARARKREQVGVKAGETGLVQLGEETGKRNKKAGYTLSARTQLGEDGPDVKVLYNPKKKILKYEVM